MSNDLYQLDPLTLAWTSFTDLVPPPGRALASFAAADEGGWLFLFGGVTIADGSTPETTFQGEIGVFDDITALQQA